MGLVTGCFSLVGIQEVISYEYIYKLTQYNVVPDTPVSSNAEGSVPEGWSSQLLGVSASLPYLWESRRQKKDSYVTRDLSSSSFTRNYWIGTNGVASYSNGYSYSEVFDLPSGQTIEVLTAGTGFSVISEYRNRSYTPIVKANGSVSEQKMYTYTADTDCQIVVSVYHLSSYSVKITSGTWGAWSTPTLKNSWGKQGAKMRMRTWTADTEYLSGADGEDFYDVVIYLEKLYLCTKSHTSEPGTNDPVTSINGYLGYWESAQDWTFIATKLLLAEKIKAEQIDADGLVAKNVDVSGKINATSGNLGKMTLKVEDGSDGLYYKDDSRNSEMSLRPNWITGVPYNVFDLDPSSAQYNLLLYLKRRRNNALDRALYVEGVAEIYGRLGVGRGDNNGFNQFYPALVAEGISCYGQFCLPTRTITTSSVIDCSSSYIVLDFPSSGGYVRLPSANLVDGQTVIIRNIGDTSVKVYGNMKVENNSIVSSYDFAATGRLHIHTYYESKGYWLVNNLN